MKLINVSKSDKTYEIKALVSYKLFGVRILSSEKTFTKKKNENEWYEAAGGKKASEEKRLKLNKWLKDHQKFIEKI